MFIPIRDDAPTIRKPYLTVTLIVVNSLVFLYSIFQGQRGCGILREISTAPVLASFSGEMLIPNPAELSAVDKSSYLT